MGEWLAFTFALTGRREWGHGTQGVALGWRLAGLSARAGPQIVFFRTIPPLNISILNTPTSSGYAAFSSNKKTAAVSNNLTAAVYL